ncbi:MAG: HIT domain-containing protein [Syntrophales bacterium]|jgi:ATP adenylyltransferase|nr:HIT domain-containing protein [Syntrophales bacterium]MDY0043524.1 HIT domain-containing protein [Syntrophales bacterium]
METIIAPGRADYVRGGDKKNGCIFCIGSAREEKLILHEGETCFVIMNKFPYTAGHVMVAPYRHLSTVTDLVPEEKLELMNLIDRSVLALKKAFNPEGFNIGMNLGKVAGAGVDQHIHIHVVPRWSGDTNFVSVLGDVRIIPEEIENTRDTLKNCF